MKDTTDTLEVTYQRVVNCELVGICHILYVPRKKLLEYEKNK